MKWAEYYRRYDEWQESTQYSRLASITDFGPEGSPSAEIADCIQYVESRAAASIIRRALAAGVRFRTTEITDIVDSGQIEDGLNELCDYGVEESLIKKISKRSGIPYADPDDPMEEPPDDSPGQKPGFLSALLTGFALFGGSKTKHTGKCTGDCAHCPPHYGYRYGRWYYGHGHTDGCEFCGNGGCNGKCHID